MVACRLTDKAAAQGMATLLFCPDESTASQLNSLLWTHSDTSFIPHQLLEPNLNLNADPSTADTQARASTSASPLVTITWAKDAPNHHGLLINLAKETPSWFSRFEALAEIIHDDPEILEYKRQRYRFYRDRGYPLAYHDLSKSQASAKITRTEHHLHSS